jgi:glyceraldehyde 3-phosphate dehydrogenase
MKNSASSTAINTIHSYTNDWSCRFSPEGPAACPRGSFPSFRRPAAKALHLVPPQLKGKLDGFASRSHSGRMVVDLTVTVEKPVSVQSVNDALKKHAAGPLKGILGVEEHELVSADFKGNPLSSIIDAPLTKVIGNMVKVISWYDNEWGYSNRVRDLILFLVKKGL